MRMAFICAVVLAISGIAAAGEVAFEAMQSQAEPVEFRVVPMETYAAFVKNWNNRDEPLRKVIRSPKEWDEAFSPAVTMGNKKPTAPDRAFFAKEQLLVVARVMPAPARGETPLTAESVMKIGGRAVLTYRYQPPAADASYTVKAVLMVAVPKDVSGPFSFVETAGK